jgi:hypothetical protein
MLESHSENTKPVDASVEGKHARSLRNSDRIKIKYGNYNIDIIENKLNIRVSKLYSTLDGVKTNRTFAVVAYPVFIEPEFKKEHEAIINGQSIGVVFEQNDWDIDKNHLYFGEIEMPPEHSGAHALFSAIGKANPAIHIYSLVVTKDNSRFEYALIAEVHHPDFLKLEDLMSIYAQGSDSQPTDKSSVNDFLQTVKSKIQDL